MHNKSMEKVHKKEKHSFLFQAKVKLFLNFVSLMWKRKSTAYCASIDKEEQMS